MSCSSAADANGDAVLARDLVFPRELVENPRRQMKRTQTMRKPRMLSRLISEIRQPQLPHPPQPLKLRRIDQLHQQPTLNRIRVDIDYVMDRIPINPARA